MYNGDNMYSYYRLGSYRGVFALIDIIVATKF